MANVQLIDEKQFDQFGLPRCVRLVSATIKNDEIDAELKRFKEQKKDVYEMELKKYRFNIRLIFTACTVAQLIEIGSNSTSLIVAIQSVVRSKGTEFLKKLADGKAEIEEGNTIRSKDHLISVGVLEFLSREKRSRIPTGVKIGRLLEGVSKEEKIQLLREQLAMIENGKQ